jgi:hypothetical protein
MQLKAVVPLMCAILVQCLALNGPIWTKTSTITAQLRCILAIGGICYTTGILTPPSASAEDSVFDGIGGYVKKVVGSYEDIAASKSSSIYQPKTTLPYKSAYIIPKDQEMIDRILALKRASREDGGSEAALRETFFFLPSPSPVQRDSNPRTNNQADGLKKLDDIEKVEEIDIADDE